MKFFKQRPFFQRSPTPATPIASEHEEFVPTGHFYSAIPTRETRSTHARSWVERRRVNTLPGIVIDPARAEAHLQRIAAAARECPFPVNPEASWRYYFENPAYSYGDALSLHAMLRHLRPRQIVEVGSGFSSAMMLDTDERWLGGTTAFTFIEPYPELLRSNFKPGDETRCTVRAEGVQDTPLTVFTSLESGDILFIDSTHVAKLGSDVKRLFLDILPVLRSGVWVHIHDIFWPFDYPPEWLDEGRAWNEAYLLHALLQHNPRYRIEYLSDHTLRNRGEWISANAPLIAKNPGGHIWLEIQ